MRPRISWPEQYVFALDTPLIVHNGRLLQPGEETNANNNYIELGAKRLTLEERATPRQLEDLYHEHNRDKVDQLQAWLTQEYFQQDFQSRAQIEQQQRRNKVLTLIVEKILPVLTADQLEDRIEEFVDDGPHEVQETEQDIQIPANVLREVQEIKRRRIQEIEAEHIQYQFDAEELPRESEVDERIYSMLRGPRGQFTRLNEPSAITELLGRYNVMIIDDKTYTLDTVPEFLAYFQEGIHEGFFAQTQEFSPSRDPIQIIDVIKQNIEAVEHKYRSRIINKLRSSHVKIDGSYFFPIFWQKTEELRNRHIKLAEKRITIEALEHGEYQTSLTHHLAQEVNRLEQAARSTRYERNGAGFLNQDSSYYVYITTPPYALVSPHLRAEPKYIAFPPAKIGVRIKTAGSGFEIGDVLLIEPYRHPFVGDRRAFYPICFGRWTRNNIPNFARKPPEEKVVDLLAQGKKTLMMGYRTGGNPYPHNSLRRERWDRWITKEQVEQQGLVCLNEFGGS